MNFKQKRQAYFLCHILDTLELIQLIVLFLKLKYQKNAPIPILLPSQPKQKELLKSHKGKLSAIGYSKMLCDEVTN